MMSKNKIVCYTCITDGYDDLLPVQQLSPNIDYICFTDNMQMEHPLGWQLRPIPDEFQHLSPVKKQRIIKILACKVVKEYDISFWIDANIKINCDLEKDVLPKYDLTKHSLYIHAHPTRDCIYQEEKAVIQLQRDVVENTRGQLKRYVSEGYPAHYGLVESCMLLRKHNDGACIRLMYQWAIEIIKGSHRDQLSFNYACWKCKYRYGLLNEDYRNKTGPFVVNFHKKRKLAMASASPVATGKKIVVYTCITGGYDILPAPRVKSTGIDYICFTDNMAMNPAGWRLKEIPADLHSYSQVKQQRLLKILPQIYLPDYDVSLWVDANITIQKDLAKTFFTAYDLSQHSLYTNKHPQRDCIYEEEKAVLKLSKDVSNITGPQIMKYHRLGYPSHNGLAETNIILRDHHDVACLEVMKTWANELIMQSHRDQLSFDFACWKHGFKYGHLNEVYRKFSSDNNFSLSKHIGTGSKSSKAQKFTGSLAVVIINYNTSALTNALVKSLRKTVRTVSYDIVVFDNSDREKFTCPDDVVLIDNSRGSLINFNQRIAVLSKVKSNNNYASFKHAMTVQFLIDNLSYDHIVLLDSDTLVKKDFDFIDQSFITVAGLQENKIKHRFKPYCQYFNTRMMKKLGIRFLDINRMHGGANPQNSKYYDTGCSFFEDVVLKKLPYKLIDTEKYIIHLKGASWQDTDQNKFLIDNKELWDNENA